MRDQISYQPVLLYAVAAAIFLVPVSIFSHYENIYISQVCDLIIFSYFIYNFRNAISIRHIISPIFIIIMTYCLYSLYMARHGGVLYSDYIYAYKSIIYSALLYIMCPSVSISHQNLGRIAKFLILLFLVEYLSIRLIFLVPRPSVFIENNYELATIVIIYYAYFSRLKRLDFRWVFALFAVLLLSGSRSALVSGVVAVAFQFKLRSPRDILVAVSATVVGLSLVYYLFMARLGDADISSIDRVNFLDAFLFDTRDWSISRYLVGAVPVTPLSREVCFDLKFYKPLFSDEGSFLCYSVILHSFILRTVFDHGVLGLLLILYIVYAVFRRRGDTVQNSAGYVLIVIANGLSVSAISNGFVVLALLIALISENPLVSSAKGRSLKSNPTWKQGSRRYGHD